MLRPEAKEPPTASIEDLTRRLQNAEERLAKTLISVPGLVCSFAVRPDGSTSMPNTTPFVEELYGLTQDELAKSTDPLFANMPPDDAERVLQGIRASAQAFLPWHDAYRYNHPKKGQRWIEGWSVPIAEPDGSVVWHGFVMDVTDRKNAEQRAARLTLLYRALSDANEAIVRIGDEDELFKVICEIVLRLGGMTGASICMYDPASDSLVARALKGPSLSGLAYFALPLALDKPGSRALTCEAFRRRELIVENALESSAASGRVEALAVHGSTASAVALPLRRGGAVVGVMTIASSELGYFDQETVHLLENLALDISIGLDKLERTRELHVSEARFRAIFEQNVVGIVIVDLVTSRFVRANDRFCEIVGYTQDELCERTFLDLTHPDERARDAASVGDLPNRKNFSVDKRYIHKNGAIVWARLSGTIVFAANAKPRYSIASVEDISMRMQTEKALRESEERYRTLIENLDDVVFSLDTEGRFTYVSRGIDVFGWTLDELLGVDFRSRIHEADHARVNAIFDRLVARERVEPFEYRILDAKGKTRFVRANARPLVEADRCVGVTGVAFDLTAQREVEEQLRLAQKMEAVGRLAGGIAHDFNNLLSVIHSYTEIALEELRQDDPLRADIQQIWAASHRAEALTRQLLAFSRKQVLKAQILDPNVLIRDMETMLRRLLGEDVVLDVDLDESAGMIKADPGQIEQVLMNLAINARDAMPEGGVLSIATGSAVIDPASAERLVVAPGPYVRLSVLDTGTGMDEQTMSRIFEPFFTTKEVGKGTGLGLATTYAIVKQTGGSVSVESKVGKGTRFDIHLPREASSGASEAAPRGAAAPASGTETVLLVEDDDAVRSLARRILVTAGYDVLVAQNAGEALLIYEKRHREIGLLITDVVMPGMNGRALADRLTSTYPEIKVLYMSGYSDDILADRGVLDERTHFITKPFTVESLTRKVREVLDCPNGLSA